MTTIAYKGGVMAADSLATCNGMRDSMALKVRRVGPLLIGGAGTAATCERFVDWVRKGMHGLSPWDGNEGGNSFIVLPDDTIVVFGQSGPWRVKSDFYAMGSGEQIALGAMAHGATAEQAVEHAIRFDIHSGGPIRTVKR
jgi:20S proteasome alpha/beta subunit